MKLFILVLVFAGFQSCRPFLIREGDSYFPDGYGQGNVGFSDWVNNWFRHAKDRIYQRLFGTDAPPPPPPSPLPKVRFDTSELEYYARTHEKEPVDLSTLSFDPELDWGFRVGKWYFIRKAIQDDFGGQDRWIPSSTVKPISDFGLTAEFTVETTSVDPELSTVYSSAATPTQPVTQFLTPAETESSTGIDLTTKQLEPASERGIIENEIENDLNAKGSVEVLME